MAALAGCSAPAFLSRRMEGPPTAPSSHSATLSSQQSLRASSTSPRLIASSAGQKRQHARLVQAAAAAPDGVESDEASAAGEEERLVFAPERHMPLPPPGWVERKKAQRAAEIAANDGVSIRRRPPSGPATHFVGAFEFRIEDDDNVALNILEEIVWWKDGEVARFKEKMPLDRVAKALAALPSEYAVRDFVGELRRRRDETGVPALIAEVKKASPSRGVIQPDFDPVRIARAYEVGGAACLSVLTDSKFFQGGFENLKLIRDAGVQCPLLCKEFIVDPWQIYYARLHGADAVLLIAAVLNDKDLRYYVKIASSLGMAALIEVHSDQEMDRVLGLGDAVQLIGINNRNLETFKVDLANTERLLEGERGQTIRDRGILVVGESGLFTPDDVARVQTAGCSAVLVGESIVKQSDPTAGIEGLFGRNIARPPSTTPPLAVA